MTRTRLDFDSRFDRGCLKLHPLEIFLHVLGDLRGYPRYIGNCQRAPPFHRCNRMRMRPGKLKVERDKDREREDW